MKHTTTALLIGAVSANETHINIRQ